MYRKGSMKRGYFLFYRIYREEPIPESQTFLFSHRKRKLLRIFMKTMKKKKETLGLLNKRRNNKETEPS